MTQTAGVTHGQTTVTNKQTELDEVRKKIEEIEYKITKLSINEAKKFAQNDLNMKSKKPRKKPHGFLFTSKTLSKEDLEAIETRVQREKLGLLDELKVLHAKKEGILATFFDTEPRVDIPTPEEQVDPIQIRSIPDFAVSSRSSFWSGLLPGNLKRILSKREDRARKELRLKEENVYLKSNVSTLQQLTSILMDLLSNDTQANFRATEFSEQLEDNYGKEQELHVQFLALAARLAFFSANELKVEKDKHEITRSRLDIATKNLSNLNIKIQLMGPLFEVGKKIRLGHLEAIKRIRYNGNFVELRGIPDQGVIDERNLTAHGGNPMADFSLISFCSLKSSEKSLIKDMYGIQGALLQEALLSSIPCKNWTEMLAMRGTMFSCYAETRFTCDKFKEMKFKQLEKQVSEIQTKSRKECSTEDSPASDLDEPPQGAILVATMKKFEEDLDVPKLLEEMRKIADEFHRKEGKRRCNSY